MEPVNGKIDIEPVLELSVGGQIRRHSAFHARTETIVHTTRWQVKFAAFLERLSANELLGRAICDGFIRGSYFSESRRNRTSSISE